MTLPEEYFDITAPKGINKRYNHGDRCLSNGEKSADLRGRLYIKRTTTGFVWYCHNCGESGKRRYNMQEVKQLALNLTPDKGVSEEPILTDLPPMDDNIPLKGWAWLKKYGITKAEVDSNMIYYSSANNRLVLPIWSLAGETMGWQGRHLGEASKSSPKYITGYLNSLKKTKSWHICNLDDKGLLLCEDIISAIKLSRFLTTCALLGSPKNLPKDFIQMIHNYGFDYVYIWMDPDKLTTAIQYAKQFHALTNVEARVIFSDRDPKEHNDHEIIDKLDAADKSLDKTLNV
jgi:hypothetical protein